MEMYTQYKTNIMIHVFNNFNCKKMQTSHPTCIHKFLGKKTILIELCIGNYVIQDCLVIGANGIFQGLITLLNSQKNGYYLIV